MAVAPRPPLATSNWLLAHVGISSDLIYSQDDLYWLIVIPNRALNRVFRCAIDRKSHMGAAAKPPLSKSGMIDDNEGNVCSQMYVSLSVPSTCIWSGIAISAELHASIMCFAR